MTKKLLKGRKLKLVKYFEDMKKKMFELLNYLFFKCLYIQKSKFYDLNIRYLT